VVGDNIGYRIGRRYGRAVVAMKRFKSLQDRILVRRLEKEDVTKGGIIIPDAAKEKPQEGKVIAVGPRKVTDDGKLQPMPVEVGDKILFGKYSGSEAKLDKEEYLVLREEDVLGILQ
jgi:chaperonin GroES